MTIKKWIIVSFGPFIIGSIIIGSINYTIDPFWTFSNTNKYNNKQNDFNERQQKTNFIYFNGLDETDGLLLGSSRTTFINQNDFVNMNIYNYSSNSMLPYEYKEYINFAKKIKGKDFKYIIIGADFFGSNTPKDTEFKKPSFYINNTEQFMYRYKLLISTNTLEQSKKTYANNDRFMERYYDRNNVKYQHKLSEEQRQNRYNITIQKHLENFDDKNYKYNENFIEIMRTLKIENPNTKFIIFTSPVTANLLVSTVKEKGRLAEYNRWLLEMIKVFGEIHHFMTINSITKDLQNYADDDHYYPHIAKLIANKLSNQQNNMIPKDFGFPLNKNNFFDFSKTFKEDLNKLD